MPHPFRDVAAAAVAESFELLGADALFTLAAGGAATPVRVMPAQADTTALGDFQVRTLQTGRAFDLMKSQVATRPERGDVIDLVDDDGAVTETFAVVESATSTDRFNLVWTCRVGPPA